MEQQENKSCSLEEQIKEYEAKKDQLTEEEQEELKALKRRFYRTQRRQRCC